MTQQNQDTLTIKELETIYQNYAPDNPVERTAVEQHIGFQSGAGPVGFIVEKLYLVRNIVIFLSSLLLLSSLSFTKIALYAQYHDQCPAAPKIPIYLLVGGITVLFAMLLTITPLVYLLMIQANGRKTAIETFHTKYVPVFRIIVFLFLAFRGSWSITATSWKIYDVLSNNINFKDVTSKNYCHKGLIYFALVTFLISWFLQISTISLLGCYYINGQKISLNPTVLRYRILNRLFVIALVLALCI